LTSMNINLGNNLPPSAPGKDRLTFSRKNSLVHEDFFLFVPLKLLLNQNKGNLFCPLFYKEKLGNIIEKENKVYERSAKKVKGKRKEGKRKRKEERKEERGKKKERKEERRKRGKRERKERGKRERKEREERERKERGKRKR